MDEQLIHELSEEMQQLADVMVGICDTLNKCGDSDSDIFETVNKMIMQYQVLGIATRGMVQLHLELIEQNIDKLKWERFINTTDVQNIKES